MSTFNMNHPSDSSSDHLLINSHDPKDYQILSTLHSSPSTTTYKARYVISGTLLRIKVFHNYMALEDIYVLSGLIVKASYINHPNIIGIHCTFKHEDQLWIVMPLADLKSLNSVMNSSFCSGLSEARMAFVLEETLKGIQRVHEHGDMHGMIDLDHVFVGEGKHIKLDLGLLSYSDVESSGQRPLWMAAPDLNGREKADIWMFGLLAMELFFGKFPASDPESFTRLVSRIKDSKESSRPKKSSFLMKLVGGCFCSTHSSDPGKMPSRLLGELIGLCLDPNPLARPTAKELLEHKFFSKPHDHIFK